jgi:hypothetical protein
MTNDTQDNSQDYPPVISYSKVCQDLMLLIGGKRTKKYPDEEKSYAQE